MVLMTTLDSRLQENTFLLFLVMNLSRVSILIPWVSQVARDLMYSVTIGFTGASCVSGTKLLLSEWRGSKKYVKFAEAETISPRREDPVLEKVFVLFHHATSCDSCMTYLG